MLARPSSLAETVIGAAIEVHRALGPGLLESAYEPCLARELILRGVPFDQQVAVPVTYKGVRIECAYRVDLMVEGRLLVELKSVEHLLPVHHAQVLTYMRLLKLPQGLLINFNERRLIDGLKNFLL